MIMKNDQVKYFKRRREYVYVQKAWSGTGCFATRCWGHTNIRVRCRLWVLQMYVQLHM